MKTKIISILKKELLIIELPEDVNLFDDLTFLNSEIEGYTLLGKPDEIREEDLDGIVSDFDAFQNTGEGTGYYDYRKSFFSVLESEIYWNVNPIPTPEIQGGYDDCGNFHGGWDDSWISAFEEAQEKTFDRTRTLIFVEN